MQEFRAKTAAILKAEEALPGGEAEAGAGVAAPATAGLMGVALPTAEVRLPPARLCTLLHSGRMCRQPTADSLANCSRRPYPPHAQPRLARRSPVPLERMPSDLTGQEVREAGDAASVGKRSLSAL